MLIPSHHKVKSDYLLIFIAKAKEGNKWSHITHAEKVWKLYSFATCVMCRWRLIPRVKPWIQNQTLPKTRVLG